MRKFAKYISCLGAAGLIILSGCSLDEELRQQIGDDKASEFGSGGSTSSYQALLGAAYNDLQGFMSLDRAFALQNVASDELIVPTRATNWGDGGKWRALHAHRWNADHQYIKDTFYDLMAGVYDATQVLGIEEATTQAVAEAKFLRGFYLFHTIDLFGQFPIREPNSDPLALPEVYTGETAINFVIKDVEEALPNLPNGPTVGIANKDAAHMLLAKLYLNRGTFLDRANPTFPEADMDKVIEHTTAIMESGHYSLADKYFDAFRPDNGQISTEVIFSRENKRGIGQTVGAGVQSRWFATLHYSMNPGGWNGFATLGEFYDKFSNNDIRKSYEDPEVKALGGPKLGFLLGQQYNKDGVALKDASGNPVSFLKDVNLVERGTTLDFAGIRVVKYTPDYSNNGAYLYAPDNDYVLFRYGDVVLMRAEALLRNGESAQALTLVNELRAKRIEPDDAFGALTFENLLDERGRELYWEGWRRQDQIRFGTFLNERRTKPLSDPKYLVYPIPNAQITVNPNLTQNPGY
ncbi:RagB/SusD family nutrient uptake outer membrane protein [Pseudochryseolinea flava]|uniref:RagB/SusD family nutrient uptake outer membrane protein n=1 Tax=Pseudochryseolinea flava TaxID=2059302 RepID=A0A364Y480_9BACT|nr:RagB/SusD family nutrient uptake outer membrane protein [Pseudochryseolinea flava]RAW00625.1 RagB/SusD family nutrient uptake outer membrane protein [Pseudochryseolinea flava]